MDKFDKDGVTIVNKLKTQLFLLNRAVIKVFGYIPTIMSTFYLNNPLSTVKHVCCKFLSFICLNCPKTLFKVAAH